MPDELWPFISGHFDAYRRRMGKSLEAQVASSISGTVVTARGWMHAEEGLTGKTTPPTSVKFLRGDFYHPVAATPETYRPTDLTIWKEGDKPTTVTVYVDGLGSVKRDSYHTAAVEAGIVQRVTSLWSTFDAEAQDPSDYFMVTLVSDRPLTMTVFWRALVRVGQWLRRLGPARHR